MAEALADGNISSGLSDRSGQDLLQQLCWPSPNGSKAIFAWTTGLLQVPAVPPESASLCRFRRVPEEFVYDNLYPDRSYPGVVPPPK